MCKGMEAVQTRETPIGFDLMDYARKHRLRTRNLHDGHPVPPARLMPKHRTRARTGYVGVSDRLDAIVGYCGALTDEDRQGLAVYLHYKTAKGVNRGIAGIKAIGGTVHLVGDFEVTGHVPWDRIEDALKLIKVSKLPPGNPNPTPLRPKQRGLTGARIA